MSKAEERALEAYPPKLVAYSDLFGEETLDDNGLKRAIFIEGYQQAEKDLELTWEDMMLIHKCIKDAMNKYLYAFQTMEGQKTVYEEVLKRFT